MNENILLFAAFFVIAVGLFVADRKKFLNLGKWNDIITIALGAMAIISLAFSFTDFGLAEILEQPVVPTNTPSPDYPNSISGSIRWNDQPIAAMSIALYKETCNYDKSLAKTESNESGYYYFRNIRAGEYWLGVNWFEPTKGYQGTCGYVKLIEGEAVNEDINLKKDDLIVISPSQASSYFWDNPILSWQEYPDTSYYTAAIYTIAERSYAWNVYYKQTANAQIDLAQETNYNTLYQSAISDNLDPRAPYRLQVTAYNANGIAIAVGYSTEFYIAY